MRGVRTRTMRQSGKGRDDSDGGVERSDAGGMSEKLVPRSSLDVIVPSGYDGLDRVYGKFAWHDIAGDPGAAIAIDPAWARSHVVAIVVPNVLPHPVYIHSLVNGPFQRALAAAVAKKPSYKIFSCCSFVPRHKNHDPKAPLSVHSCGRRHQPTHQPARRHHAVAGGQAEPAAGHDRLVEILRSAGRVRGRVQGRGVRVGRRVQRDQGRHALPAREGRLMSSSLSDMQCCSVCEIDGVALASCPSCQVLLCPSCKLNHVCRSSDGLATEKTQPGIAILECPCGSTLLSHDEDERRKFAEEHAGHAEAGPS